VHVSDGLCDLLGYGRDELLRIPADERPWFPDRERAAEGRGRIVDRTVAVGRHSADLDVVARDGRRMRVLATSRLLPERDVDGGPLFFALFRDATTLSPGGPGARRSTGSVAPAGAVPGS
jgi:PAS domain-containing protein